MSKHRTRQRADRLPPAQRVAAILDAARQVFHDKGYHEALISEIADRLGVVDGTIYRYFGSKRDLLVAVVEEWYTRILSDFDRELHGISSTRDRLRFMIWRHLVLIHQEPEMCRLVFGELRAGPEYRQTSVYQLNRSYTRRTLSIVENAMASGEFRSNLPLRIVRDLLFGCVEHHTWAYLRGEGDFSPDDAADAIVDIVYRGLATEDLQSADQVLRRMESAAARFESAAKDLTDKFASKTSA